MTWNGLYLNSIVLQKVQESLTRTLNREGFKVDDRAKVDGRAKLDGGAKVDVLESTRRLLEPIWPVIGQSGWSFD